MYSAHSVQITQITQTKKKFLAGVSLAAISLLGLFLLPTNASAFEVIFCQDSTGVYNGGQPYSCPVDSSNGVLLTDGGSGGSSIVVGNKSNQADPLLPASDNLEVLSVLYGMDIVDSEIHHVNILDINNESIPTPTTPVYGTFGLSGDLLWTGTAWVKAPGDATNGAFVQLKVSSGGGASTGRVVAATGTNAISLVAGAHTVTEISISGAGAAQECVNFYDKATAPIVGTDTIAAQYCVPGSTLGTINNPNLGILGKKFITGIAIALTLGITGTIGVTTSDISLTIGYK